MQLLPIHLVIMQPAGYVHSLAFVDHVRYLRFQFRRFGADVTLGKNRLREDAINFVFGAHLGFPPEWRKRHICVFVNLEQLGEGGACVDPAYVDLLRTSAVVDYDVDNAASYAHDVEDVPLVPFLYAPYLADPRPIPLAERPIDLLFFGSTNSRRKGFIESVEACGASIAIFDQPLYADERDDYIRQAKAVINCHFYESSRFEQARVFQCLSLGTPVISERTPRTNAPAAYEDAVFWLESHQQMEHFFRERFNTPGFFDEAQARLAAFRQQDPQEAYGDLLAFANGYAQAWRRTNPGLVWEPTEMNLGSGKDYKVGWLNVDVLDRAEPDVVLDLGRPITLPLQLTGCRGGLVRLAAGSLERVYANNVLEHVPDLPSLMTNVLALLKEGGEFQIEVPYEKSTTAWQDPTHLRAMNEQSWQYYTSWFWYLGWFEHRFEMTTGTWLDLRSQPCAQEQAAFMKVTLRKVGTTANERTIARTMQANLGGIPDDLEVFQTAEEIARNPHEALST
jgi:SAM-dependent methyltransferase